MMMIIEEDEIIIVIITERVADQEARALSPFVERIGLGRWDLPRIGLASNQEFFGC